MGVEERDGAFRVNLDDQAARAGEELPEPDILLPDGIFQPLPLGLVLGDDDLAPGWVLRVHGPHPQAHGHQCAVLCHELGLGMAPSLVVGPERELAERPVAFLLPGEEICDIAALEGRGVRPERPGHRRVDPIHLPAGDLAEPQRGDREDSGEEVCPQHLVPLGLAAEDCLVDHVLQLGHGPGRGPCPDRDLGREVDVAEDECVLPLSQVEDEGGGGDAGLELPLELDPGHVGKELYPVDLGDAVVRDDDVVPPAPCPLEGLFRGVDDVDPDVAPPLEEHPRTLDGVRVVMHEEDVDHGLARIGSVVPPGCTGTGWSRENLIITGAKSRSRRGYGVVFSRAFRFSPACAAFPHRLSRHGS